MNVASGTGRSWVRCPEPWRSLSRFVGWLLIAAGVSIGAAPGARAAEPPVTVYEPVAAAPDPVASAAAPPASAAPPAPPVPPAREEKAESSSGQLWPSFVLEPGAGVVVAPRVLGAGVFGFSAGLVYVRSKRGGDGPHSLFGAHVGYTFAPRANRAELTFTAGHSVAGYFVLSLRGGPTVDTDGNFGFRAGLRGSALHLVGFELLVHHAFVAGASETSLLGVFSLDLVPAAGVFLLAQALSGLLK